MKNRTNVYCGYCGEQMYETTTYPITDSKKYNRKNGNLNRLIKVTCPNYSVDNPNHDHNLELSSLILLSGSSNS